MQIIYLDRRRMRVRNIACGRHVPLLLGLLLGLLFGGATFQLGIALERDGTARELTALTLQAGEEARAQRDELDSVRLDIGRQVDAMAVRVGRMQARGVRLDALGERLAGLAGLDPQAFDFRNPPALGGPSGEQADDSSSAAALEQVLLDLERELEAREELYTLVESYLADAELTRRILPTGRPLAEGWISSRYGQRIDPVNGKRSHHEGIDFAGRAGSDVIAVAAGVVTWSAPRSGYGKLVEIDHGKGFVTRYGHNRENLVAVGDVVAPGQAVARLGSTGRSTGPHVHFEVLLNGRPVNPMRYVLAER